MERGWEEGQRYIAVDLEGEVVVVEGWIGNVREGGGMGGMACAPFCWFGILLGFAL